MALPLLKSKRFIKFIAFHLSNDKNGEVISTKSIKGTFSSQKCKFYVISFFNGAYEGMHSITEFLLNLINCVNYLKKTIFCEVSRNLPENFVKKW